MAKKKTNSGDPVLDRADRVVHLLEDLFILNARAGGMKSDDIRSLLAIDKKRVNRVSRLLKGKSE